MEIMNFYDEIMKLQFSSKIMPLVTLQKVKNLATTCLRYHVMIILELLTIKYCMHIMLKETLYSDSVRSAQLSSAQASSIKDFFIHVLRISSTSMHFLRQDEPTFGLDKTVRFQAKISSIKRNCSANIVINIVIASDFTLHFHMCLLDFGTL